MVEKQQIKVSLTKALNLTNDKNSSKEIKLNFWFFVCVPFSTMAMWCMRGSHMRHWGGSTTMSRNTLSITLFWHKIQENGIRKTRIFFALYDLHNHCCYISRKGKIWCANMWVPVVGSRKMQQCKCSRRKVLHARLWELWEPLLRSRRILIEPRRQLSQTIEKRYLHTHRHTLSNMHVQDSAKTLSLAFIRE